MDFLRPLLALAPDYKKRNGRPFVTLSYAQSLDGCISARPGEPLALSGQRSLRLTHQLRAAHDAILVGIGTVFSDNPRLTVRLVNGSNPRPVVVDSFLRIPLDCNIMTESCRDPIIITSKSADENRLRTLESMGASVIRVNSNDKGLLKLSELLSVLADLSINSLMVEGGARIITSFLIDKLPDFVVLTIAPVMVGGLRAVSDLGESDPNQFLRLQDPGHRWLGNDLILWGNLICDCENHSEFSTAIGGTRF
ncbi:MAG: RibD family protein [Deltaproteobacteria bacterium]|nr:RibD family protein [Deltaproteobacteria bacterium]